MFSLYPRNDSGVSAVNITIGTDAEVLLRRRSNNGLVSAIGLIGGSKEEPLVVPRGNLQEDNVLAEFAIDPVLTEEDFVNSILEVMNALRAKIEPMELRIDIKSSGVYPKSQLNHPMALRFGCDPDYNAWTLEPNRAPNPEEVGRLRTCGGHIHVGFEQDPDDLMAGPELARWMDLYLGIPSVILDPDTRRRQVYGKAGAFRPKPYGIEYRVLSNFWIKNPILIRWAYRQAKEAYEMFSMAGPLEDVYPHIFPHVQETINSSNKEVARQIIREVRMRIPNG